MMRFRVLITAGLFLGAAAGCASGTGAIGSAEVCAAQASTRHELLFGLSRPDGRQISGPEFEQFLSEVVTPLFGDGLTVVDGSGQYRTAAGDLIRESSKVVVLIYPDVTETRERIGRVIAQYRSRFQQESVGWIRTPALACFEDA
jgi:hypothetical protein